MDEVRAVMDAVGSERAVLFGTIGGGAMSGLFAATFPERALGSSSTAPSAASSLIPACWPG